MAKRQKKADTIAGSIELMGMAAAPSPEWPNEVQRSADPSTAAAEEARYISILEMRDNWAKFEMITAARLAVLEILQGRELDVIRHEGTVIEDHRGNSRPSSHVAVMQGLQSQISTLTRQLGLGAAAQKRELQAGGKAMREAKAVIDRVAEDSLLA